MTIGFIKVRFRHVVAAVTGVATIVYIFWGAKRSELAESTLSEDTDIMNDEVINGRIDFFESPSAYLYNIDMPGVGQDEVTIEVEDNGQLLVISGKRKAENATEGSHVMEESSTTSDVAKVKYVNRERKMGRFLKMFLLPENANPDNITASTMDGVLVIKVEKLSSRIEY